MAYIGKEPAVGNFQVCDAISVVNGQAAYTMQVSSTNVVPESANHMLVSLNGILQKPNSSFTVSGSTITFASNLATGDVIDFIMLLGNVLDIGTPSDSTVTDAKANFVSTSSAAGLQIKGDGTTDGTLQLNCSQNSHGIKLASPAHSAGQSYKLIFPAGNVTAGKVLKVDSVSGSGTTGIGTLTFGDAGGLVKLAATTVSSNVANVDFTTQFTSDYSVYKIIVQGARPDTDNNAIAMRLGTGSSFDSGSNYERYLIAGGRDQGNDSVDSRGGTPDSMSFNPMSSQSSGAETSTNLEITLYNMRDSAKNTYATCVGAFEGADDEFRTLLGSYNYNQTNTRDSVRFFNTSGNNIATGTFTVYGVVT